MAYEAAAVRHALNGATAPELMAWFGWKTIGEAQRYVEEARRLATGVYSSAARVEDQESCLTAQRLYIAATRN
jgi:hypothetical protein